MKRLGVFILVGLMAPAITAQAAMELSYATNGDMTTITAADGANASWQMEVDTGASKPGRIMSFTDLSGASDPAFNYATRYGLGHGMFQPADWDLRHSGNRTISGLTCGADTMSFSLSTVETQDDGNGGTLTITSTYTIGTPVLSSAGGYETAITVCNTWLADANWDGANGDIRTKPFMWLYASASDGSGGEWTAETYNGFPDGVDYQTVVATATGADAAMAAGSTFTLTNAWCAADGAYDAVSTKYGALGEPYFQGAADIGATGAWAGNPGPAGETRCYTTTTTLDIAIVPEPATLSLLALGALAAVRKRRR